MTCISTKTLARCAPMVCVLLLAACAPVVPKELASAREANAKANTGQSAKLAPAEVHQANDALATAEKAFEEDENSYATRDLAYVAKRKAQFAVATASILAEKEAQQASERELRSVEAEANARTARELSSTKGELLASQQGRTLTVQHLADEKTARAATEQKLVATEAALNLSKKDSAKSAEQLAAEREARIAAEAGNAEARDALAKLAELREDPRGTVVTLSGSVLFASGEAELLPTARTRISQVAKILLSAGSRQRLLVEGFTDSQGSEAYNLRLSQRRAEAVRAELVSQSYPASHIEAIGRGESKPVADNASPEGRANNRRVEIVIEHGGRA